MKKVKLLLCVFILSLGIVACYNVFAAQSQVKVNTNQIDLYFLDDSAKELGVTIPAEYKDSYQLSVTGTNIIPDYSTDTVGQTILKISEDGLISLRNTFGDYMAGECIVTVSVGNEDFEVKVNVHDYLDTYIDNMHREYVRANINDSMTDRQKIEKICDFVVKYEYGGTADYRYMPLRGQGDCIASSQTIINMCKMVGIKAYERYAAFEPGAGNNHRNVTAMLDGEVYTIDAGYNEPAPRTYTIEKEEGGFTFGWEADTKAPLLIQYNGFEENITVPDKFSRERIDGKADYPIEVIGEYSFERPARTPGAPAIKTVTLPSTVKKICDYAFADCKDLTTINIPESLEEIGKYAFSECESLTTFNVDPKNEHYTFEDGILYNKDKTEVILCAPGKEGVVVLDDNVTTIKENAFYKCNKLTGVVLGDKVTTIEPHAFAYCNMYGINIPKSVTEIGNAAFENSYVRYVKFEEGCNASLKNDTFFACGNLAGVMIPSSMSDIDANAFRSSNKVNFYVVENSPAQTWAQTNSKSYETYTPETPNVILPGMIVLKQSVYDYDGEPKTPDVVVVDGGVILQPNTDYTVEYKDNINAHTTTPKVIVKGINKYSGTAEKEFTINKIKSDFTINVKDSVYSEPLNIELIGNNSGYNIVSKKYNTTKSTTGASTTEPKDAGEYYVQVSVSVPKNYNYKTRTIWAKFSILPAENELEITCSNVEEGRKPNVKVVKNKSGATITYYYKEQGKPDTEYSQEVPTTIGKYTVKAVSAKTNNYKEGIAIADFEIIKGSGALKGDLDRNGQVDTADAAVALNLFKYKNFTEDDIAIGDMDENGIIDTADAAEILNVFKYKGNV